MYKYICVNTIYVITIYTCIYGNHKNVYHIYASSSSGNHIIYIHIYIYIYIYHRYIISYVIYISQTTFYNIQYILYINIYI